MPPAAPPPYPPPPPHPPAHAFPGYGAHGAQPAYPRDPFQVVQVSPQTYARGKQLVFWSRMMVLGGFLMGFAGCGGMAVLPRELRGAAFGIGVLLACVIVIAAAVVGTVGRRLQGRIL